jgi:hypothetical protein
MTDDETDNAAMFSHSAKNPYHRRCGWHLTGMDFDPPELAAIFSIATIAVLRRGQ